ncbi:hypothetical protein [Sulfurirhabdus autotrophica]|uniref:Uncharacterized protein n=1 Tax=Sulfurirhabdus autotrophica TaxID=1706046 RepID=A0A4R3Y3P1_9PROT|nr:hypothetical protein [Sulfurirhabdus autotrophica]TCV85358.1 hypothetical protein EDC63_10929 [Sulfurirhabdus autotrophica]
MVTLRNYAKYFAAITAIVLSSIPQAHSETIDGTAFYQASEHIITDIIASQDVSGSSIEVIGNLVQKIDSFATENKVTAEKIVQASLNDEAVATKAQSLESPRDKSFIISSEAQMSCRLPGLVKDATNFKRVTDHECLCELYKRSPAAGNAGATEGDLHWFTQCKKARYKVSFYQAR